MWLPIPAPRLLPPAGQPYEQQATHLLPPHATLTHPAACHCSFCRSLLTMGEGMLVGSFARALFVVHSECAESRYIASRPFRVNAGPVRAGAAGRCGRLVGLEECMPLEATKGLSWQRNLQCYLFR